MNVLFVSDFEITPISGGMEKIVDTLRSEFRKRNIGCYESYFCKKNVGQHSEFDGILYLNEGEDFAALESFVVDNKVDVIVTALSQKRHFVPYMPLLRDVTNRHGIKLVYGYYVMPASETASVVDWDLARYRWRMGNDKKEILSSLAITLLCKLGLRPLLNKMLVKKLVVAQYADLVVVLSDYYIKSYKQLLSNDINVPFVTIPNPLAHDPMAESVKVYEKQKLVINISRYDVNHKRQNDLIDIWQLIERDDRLHDWRLIMVGYGNDEAFVKEYARKKRLKRLEFRSACAPQQLYGEASIYALTSSFEGLPMVLLEAMQYGVVPVSVDSYAAVHDIIVDEQNGSIVAYGNKRQFANALTKIMLDDNHRNDMALKSIDLTHRFDTQIVVEKWITQLSNLIDNK